MLIDYTQSWNGRDTIHAMRPLVLGCLFAVSLAAAEEPKAILLWPNGAPASQGKTAAETTRLTPDGEHAAASIPQPSTTAYPPTRESATGAAVGSASGGGHRE